MGDAVHPFRRPNTKQVMENYGVVPREEDIQGWYFAVFQYVATTSRSSLEARLVDEAAVPFEGAEMGPILGKGSFGSVYRATWGGKIVAIKVC